MRKARSGFSGGTAKGTEDRVFCPNCGTQNSETAATCAKCNFNLKAASAPKFKGTMLMMNNQPGVPAPPAAPPPAGAAAPPVAAPPPAEGLPPAQPAPMPSKLKGTMVGVAPMGGMAPAPPKPPAADVPPPPPFVANAPSPFGPGGSGTNSPVNPLGGTIAADGPNAFGFGAPPIGTPPPQPAGAYGAPPDPQGGYGGGGYGGGGFPQQGQAPQQGGQDWGQPQQPQAWGPPPQQGQQAAQDWGQSPQQAMAPYGAPAGGYGGQAMAPAGAHGPKGQVRNPINVLLIGIATCGIYALIWRMQAYGEMSAYLQRDEPSFWKIFLLTMVTCGVYGLYWNLTRLGALVQEMQQRAGIANAQNLSWQHLIPYYNVILLQQELNKVWQAPG